MADLSNYIFTKGNTASYTGLVATGNIVPSVDNTYFLGNSTNRWANIFLGPGTLYITDSNIASNATAELTVLNGVLQIGGVNQIQAPGIINGTSNIAILANSSIQMGIPSFNANIGAVSIVGSPDGNSVSPQNPGVMLHLTGATGNVGRIYNDAVGNYAALVGRRYNGTADSPTQVLANSIVSRYAATPYTSSGWPALSTARIDMVTTENQTSTNQGTEIQFWTTSLGSNTIAKVMSLTNSDINLDGNITAIGNATFSTNPAYVNSITVSGTAYDAQMVIDDVDGGHVAQLILNRASTSIQPIIASALNNSDDPAANVDVTNGQTLFQIAALGFAGVDYKEFTSITFYADDNGNISETSSPGKLVFSVTPDGSTNTNDALTIRNNGTLNLSNGLILNPSNIPGTSKGNPGDLAGMFALDNSYIYYCTADYTDGTADIWNRTAQTGGTW